MKKIQNYLKLLYIQSGVTLTVNDIEDVFASYNSNNIIMIYTKLMKLRQTDYNLYLNCLSAILLIAHFNLKESIGFYRAMDEALDELTDEEYQSLEEAREHDEKFISAKKTLFYYINTATDLKDLDETLYKNKCLDLICLLIPYHINHTFEESYEFNCYNLFVTSEILVELARYIPHQVFNNIAYTGIDYAIEEDPESLIYIVRTSYELTKSIEAAKEVHKLLLDLFNKHNSIDEFASYIFDFIWSIYKNCKLQEDSYQIDEKSEQFIIDFEDNPNYHLKLCLELLSDIEHTKLFEMFLDDGFEEYIQDPDAAEETSEKALLLEEFLDNLYKQKKEETNKFIRKLIPQK